MISIFELAQGQKVMLEERENCIFARQLVGKNWENEIMLADHVKKYLAACVYQKSLFFLYEDQQEQILLRNIYDTIIYFQYDAEKQNVLGGAGQQGGLLVLENQLLLFLILSKEEGNPRIQLIYPFERNRDQFLFCGDRDVENGKQQKEIEKLLGEIEEQQKEREKLLEQVEEQRNEREKLLEQMKEQQKEREKLLEQVEEQRKEQEEEVADRQIKEREMEEKQKKLEAQLIEKEKQNENLRSMIESAKRQYNELMDVATKYRDEVLRRKRMK